VSKLLKVSLIITLNDNATSVKQYQCQVEVCVNREQTCSTYHIIIPDIDVINGRILQRTDLFYHWQKLNFTGEIQTTGKCDNMKLYMLMKNPTQGELIVIYSPSVTVNRD